MKTLLVYYSRTGVTKKLANFIVGKFIAETEEIKDTANRAGVTGYLSAGRDATMRRLTKLEAVENNPADFDLVIIGTPIWAWNMAAPIRTYLTEYKDRIKQAAFFCTMGSSGDQKAFKEMAEILGKAPVAVVSLTTKEVVSGETQKAEKFCEEIIKKNI